MASSASSASASPLRFGPFDVSTQVFYTTPLSFALVNLKPLLPGHVLVCPRQPHRRLTDLDPDELADLFGAVQTVQRMLAAHFFRDPDHSHNHDLIHTGGGFNIAVQDGPDAGQTVPHVHVHVIPRIHGATAKDTTTDGDALYEQMAAEPGNVGGAQWDAAADASIGSRPKPGGRFPHIEDSNRKPRSMAEMEAEAAVFRKLLTQQTRLEQDSKQP
ncbi:hit domain containing protein [Grosmannia clavigera kw1407]|uniref:Bis(5'-adenosyl)-triphosphatase n=1 Tax=Grosmannia clavigera (strain kw1407 / UAMH 11150) TaxID=655863 RepID=F0XHU6_GROCL|nr:hit domain containing protein [Grosmannia clavigera kw1407]EFX02631.1 hit domain containing protein [Grosmannia clavigera kw1407]